MQAVVGVTRRSVPVQAMMSGVVSPISGTPSMTGVLEPPSGNGESPVSGALSITGLFESPSVRGAVRGSTNAVVGGCDAPGVSGGCSDNDCAGWECVADDSICAIVGW